MCMERDGMVWYQFEFVTKKPFPSDFKCCRCAVISLMWAKFTVGTTRGVKGSIRYAEAFENTEYNLAKASSTSCAFVESRPEKMISQPLKSSGRHSCTVKLATVAGIDSD